MKNIFKFLALFFILFSPINSLNAWFFDPDEPDIPYCWDNSDAGCWLEDWIKEVKKTIDPVVETDRKLSEYAQDIVVYLLWFLTLISILYIIYAWFNILIWAWDEEKMKKSKTTIIYVIIWLLVIWLAWPITEFFIRVFTSSE